MYSFKAMIFPFYILVKTKKNSMIIDYIVGANQQQYNTHL